MSDKLTPITCVKLSGIPIFKQLQYEEALLRSDQGNWCLISKGSPPAIVLGISAKAELHLNLDLIEKNPMPVIRRFTGGGTVIIDENTLFVTFICNADSMNISPFPQQVLQWSENFYRQVFLHDTFRLIENDFAMGDLKFGGNAQYMQKGRWLLHTSFLWDYQPERMNYLRMPPKMPKYRTERKHTDFLCKLCNYYSCKDEIETNLLNTLQRHFTVNQVDATELDTFLELPHRKSSHLIR